MVSNKGVGFAWPCRCKSALHLCVTLDLQTACLSARLYVLSVRVCVLKPPPQAKARVRRMPRLKVTAGRGVDMVICRGVNIWRIALGPEDMRGFSTMTQQQPWSKPVALQFR